MNRPILILLVALLGVLIAHGEAQIVLQRASFDALNSTSPHPSPSTSPSTSPSPSNQGDKNTEEIYNIVQMCLGGALVLFGIVFIAAGYRLLKYILFVTGFIIFFFITYSIVHTYATNLALYIIYAIAGGAGILGGLLMVVIYKVGVFFAGLAAGALFAAMVISLTPLNHLLLDNLDDSYEMWVILGIIVAVGLIVALLSIKLVRPITVIATSLFGSGLFISGLSMFPFIADTGVSVAALQRAFLKGKVTPFSTEGRQWVPYVILGVYIFLAIVGILIQFKFTAKKFRHKKKRRSIKNEEEGYPLLVQVEHQ